MKEDAIVIFEDDRRFAKELHSEIRSFIRPKEAEILIFPTTSGMGTKMDSMFETRIESDLAMQSRISPVLFVCDRDLSGTEDYTGLSEAAVSSVAEKLGVPVCLYARGMTGSVIERAQEWRSRQMILNWKLGKHSLAQHISQIYRGFRQLNNSCKVFLSKSSSKTTPANALAHALSRPEIVDKLALYGAGDLSNLAAVFHVKAEKASDRAKRLSKLLGLWLWDSVLRFPGVLVNEVAAASYIGIDLSTFRTVAVKKIFARAKYRGPFDAPNDFWWRDRIDEMIFGKGHSSGFEMLHLLLPNVRVKQARCHVDGKPPAGFYCMFHEKPVSDRNSMGNLTWFPSGADLSRLTKSVYEELAPWVGLY